MIVWAQNNNGEYPLPSRLDRSDMTVAAAGRAKDTTANIFSMLIYSGFIPPEMCVSPAETNRRIRMDEDYEFAEPAAAKNPRQALWDPAFSADFTDGKRGNVSYAHLELSGRIGGEAPSRLGRWRDTFNSMEVAIVNRGPQIAGAAKNEDGSVTAALANPESNTLRIHGDGTAWSGHAGFNDASVVFVERKLGDGMRLDASNSVTYTAADGREWADIFCFDEPDDPKSLNNYLGIFTTAGEKPGDFTAIWD